MLEYFQHHIRGHIQYYEVSGNIRWVTSYVYFATKLLFKWLNRRSQRRSIYWVQFKESSSSGYPAFGLSTTFIPRRCIGLKLGAGWCNAPSPVLRGAGDVPGYG
jgi:hypothetical protein